MFSPAARLHTIDNTIALYYYNSTQQVHFSHTIFRRTVLYKSALCMLLPVLVSAQQLVSSFSIDTTKYKLISSSAIRGPEQQNISFGNHLTTEFISAYRLKNTDKCDLYSFSGKIATITVADKIEGIQLSQFFIDDDAGWEYIGSWLDRESSILKSTVFDENGNELLYDSGGAFYGYDGQNTYVCYYTMDQVETRNYKVWRFRTNVTSSVPQNLSKASSARLQRPIITYCSSGNYRVSLKPVSGGKTSVQICDLMGRLTFSKVFDELKETTTFTVPTGNVPQTPFITRATNENGQSVQATLPLW